MAKKYKGQVFKLKRRTSQTNGAIKTHKMDPELTAALGQGVTVAFHGKVTAIDQNGRLNLKVTTGGLGDELPSSEGFAVSTTGDSPTRTSVGAFRFETTGTLLAGVEVEADIDDSVGSAEVGVEYELWATVIL